ncbi:Elongation of very long chain fatty acids protein 1 [Halotydeus destructor]|nr:Elongation of very long chain fatty acids protein 1 [Halotydeus destructor]
MSKKVTKGPVAGMASRRFGKASDNESRTALLQKMKLYEDEMARIDLERSRLLQQLDKVCEEKDELIKQLRSSLYEKQVESEHQVSLFRDEKRNLTEEINNLKSEMDQQLAFKQSDLGKISEERDFLEAQLREVQDYMIHKDITMERIKELEDKLIAEKKAYDAKINSLQDKVEVERNNIREEITREVQKITQNLEGTCLAKLTLDSQLALGKFAQVNQSLEDQKKQVKQLTKHVQLLKETLHQRTIRLEVSESLLCEMLKQMQRKFNKRKDFAVQIRSLKVYRITMSPSGILSPFYQSVRYVYYDMWNQLGDPRVQHYPLMDGGPWSTIALMLGYLYFVKVSGPKMMKERKPYELKGPLFCYNVALIALNSYFFYMGCTLTNFGIDSWNCQAVDYKSQSFTDLIKIQVGWLFLASKFIDFCDTFFFILRKKERQVSPLHVFHHAIMPLFCWIGVKFAPGGNSAFFPFLNAGVHTVMYTYYLLSTFESVRPYLWWKKYITQMQMAQFILVIIHSIYSMVVPGCQWPKPFIYMSIFNAFVFLYLFYSFFRRTYEEKKQCTAKTK